MLWNYFGTGHGKGEWDGAGAIVKRALWNEQLLNHHRRLQNAADCVQFLDATMAGQVPTRVGSIKFVRILFLLCLLHVVTLIDTSGPCSLTKCIA